MKNVIGFRTVKTWVGAAVAMVLAEIMGLAFSASAGIITILSIQDTKRVSCQIAIRRLIATVIALTIGTVLFEVIDFHAIVFPL
ncbi:aromatic acid exporter family protein [Cellulosilyticum ruminicola]|uniref:aromatic acid exporter family protein n=1 Tax=Cellulosilyticum ruminicola TaxID=425254 RepID=UPI0006D01CB3|nr:aromatic acid exporter family protein [Cellulosilyticum ruminicola]